MAGFQEADVLIAGMKAGMEGKSLFTYKDRYAAGERELAFLKDYVVALEGAFLKDDIEKNYTRLYENDTRGKIAGKRNLGLRGFLY